jgi:hypothetical protein
MQEELGGGGENREIGFERLNHVPLENCRIRYRSDSLGTPCYAGEPSPLGKQINK